MTERDSGPQVCNVLSVVIVSCKLCCLNAVSKRKTLPRPRLGPHACCGMFIATLQSRKLKLVTTCGLGASRQDRKPCGYNPLANNAFCTYHKPPKKAFYVDKLLACCLAEPDLSQEYKLFGCVGCEV